MTLAKTNMPGSATQVVFALLHPFLTKDSNHHHVLTSTWVFVHLLLLLLLLPATC